MIAVRTRSDVPNSLKPLFAMYRAIKKINTARTNVKIVNVSRL